MKKIILILALVSLAANATAQDATGINLGGGFIHNFYSVDSPSQPQIDNACYFGPYIEFGYDLNLGKHTGMYFALRYEFMHKYTGASGWTFTGIPVYAQNYTYRHYIDIPIKFLYSTKISYSNKFFFDLGPTVNFWLGNYTRGYAGSPYSYGANTIHWLNSYPDLYNRVNLSLGANVGVIIEQTKIFIGYDYGGLFSFTKPENYGGRGQIHQLRIGAQYVF